LSHLQTSVLFVYSTDSSFAAYGITKRGAAELAFGSDSPRAISLFGNVALTISPFGQKIYSLQKIIYRFFEPVLVRKGLLRPGNYARQTQLSAVRFVIFAM